MRTRMFEMSRSSRNVAQRFSAAFAGLKARATLGIWHSALGWQGPILLGLAVIAIGAGGDRPSLIDAAKNSDRSTVRLLVQQGTNVNQTEADGTTALHWASYRDDLESAE